ncbi:hypothetical protein R2R35_16010 [Anaerocolumna sp. AGMB13020]|uniref:hypothetical protein n=1 Tax=Anaerocolumna sp. AGMB13020 TaxID=3081750 RepID=UPI002954137C|nr:hypothetical protein [Anaerocolumna sp. AGMB13020]WOO35294.1 hypothetical protein R2R35_16010 [Anaerocolumna sp. AGMB13020]
MEIGIGLRKKIVLIITILAGSFILLTGVLHLVIRLIENGIRKTNGAIGSADGPVSILISDIGAFDFVMLLCLGITSIGIIYLLLSRNKQK